MKVITWHSHPAKRVQDADSAYCDECGHLVSADRNQAVPWTWRQSQAMHERGSGHKMTMQRMCWDSHSKPTVGAYADWIGHNGFRRRVLIEKVNRLTVRVWDGGQSLRLRHSDLQLY